MTFKEGTTARPGNKLYFRFKRYMYDQTKAMCQDDDCLKLDPSIKLSEDDADEIGRGGEGVSSVEQE